MNSPLETMMNLNEASLLLANKRAALGNAWCVKGSILDRAKEILEHAQTYLSTQCEEIGNNL